MLATAFDTIAEQVTRVEHILQVGQALQVGGDQFVAEIPAFGAAQGAHLVRDVHGEGSVLSLGGGAGARVVGT